MFTIDASESTDIARECEDDLARIAGLECLICKEIERLKDAPAAHDLRRQYDLVRAARLMLSYAVSGKSALTLLMDFRDHALTDKVLNGR